MAKADEKSENGVEAPFREHMRAARDRGEGERDFVKDLGRRVRARRGSLDGMTLEELSARTGLSLSYLSRMERGLILNIRLPELRAIGRALDVSLDALIHGREMPGDVGLTRALERHPELQSAFAAIADGFDWMSPDDERFMLATLEALAERARSVTRARQGQG